MDIILQAGGGGMGTMPIIMLAMLAVFYFFMIRPQQKKQNEQKKFLADLTKGQKVVTMGGIHGKIVSVNPDGTTLLLEVAEGTKIKIDRSVISMEYSALANEPAKAD
ncbi:MAG: preprotein translocase subunit YajC [Bacteroidetes bacterium]|nr:preprotein translocase subunit YajC [Bacteroidota bacterium]